MKKLLTMLFIGILTSAVQAANFYWVGGSGNWSDFGAHWATTSGGGVFHGNAPTINDNVFFDANSVLGAGVITINTDASCLNLDMSGLSFATTFTGLPVRVWYVGGNMKLNSQANFTTYLGGFELTGIAAGNSSTIITDGVSLANSDFTINNSDVADKYILLSNDLIVADLEIVSGGFNLFSQNVKCTRLDADVIGDAVRYLDFSGKQIEVSGSGNTDVVDFKSSAGNFSVFNANTSTLKLVGVGRVVMNIGDFGLDIPNILVNNSSDVDIFSLNGSDATSTISFNDITVTTVAANVFFDIDPAKNGLRKTLGAVSFPDNTTFRFRSPNGISYGNQNSIFRSTLVFGDRSDGLMLGNYTEFQGDVTFGNDGEFEFRDRNRFQGNFEVGRSIGNLIRFVDNTEFNGGFRVTGSGTILLTNNVTFNGLVTIDPSINVQFNNNSAPVVTLNNDVVVSNNSSVVFGNANNGTWNFVGRINAGNNTALMFNSFNSTSTVRKMNLAGDIIIDLTSKVTFLDSVVLSPSADVVIVNQSKDVISSGEWQVGANGTIKFGNGGVGNWTFSGNLSLAGNNSIEVNTSTSTFSFANINIGGDATFLLKSKTNLTGAISTSNSSSVIFDNTNNPVVSLTGNINVGDNSSLNLGNGKIGTWTATSGTITTTGTSTIILNSSTTPMSLRNIKLGAGTTLKTNTAATNVITGALTSTATVCASSITFKSITDGVRANLSLNGATTTVNAFGVQDINISSGVLNVNSGFDLGNNNLTNISFGAGAAYTMYWVGGMSTNTKTGIYSTGVNSNWSNPDNWSLTSGVYSGNNYCLPSYLSSVNIDNLSIDGGGTNSIALDVNAKVKSINFSLNDDAISFSDAGGTTLSSKGDVLLDDQLNLSGFTGTIQLEGDGSSSTFNFNSGGVSLSSVKLLINTTDAYQLISNNLTIDRFLLQSGSFSLNSKELTTNVLDFDVTGDNLRSFNFTSQKVTITGLGQVVDFGSIGARLSLLNSTAAELEFLGVGNATLTLGGNPLIIPILDFQGPTDIDITTSLVSNNTKLMRFGNINVNKLGATFDIDNGNVGLRKDFANLTLANNCIFNIENPNGTAFGTLNSDFNSVTIGSGANGRISGAFLEIKGGFNLGSSSELEFEGKVEFEGIVVVNSTIGNHLVFANGFDMLGKIDFYSDATIRVNGTSNFIGNVDLGSNVDLVFLHTGSPTITTSGTWRLASGATINTGNSTHANWTFGNRITLAGNNFIYSRNTGGNTIFSQIVINGTSFFVLGSAVHFSNQVDVNSSIATFSNFGGPTITGVADWNLNGNSLVNFGNGNSGVWRFTSGTVSLLGTSTLIANAVGTKIELFNVTQAVGTSFKLGTSTANAIKGTYSATGTSCSASTNLSSITSGARASLELNGNQTISGVLVRDLNITSGNLIVEGGIDFSNNDLTNLSFLISTFDLFWVGGMSTNTKTGTFSTGVNNNWSNPDNWSQTSGVYTAGNGCIPSIVTDVYFDQASFDGGSNVVAINSNVSSGHLDFSTNDNNIFITGTSSTLSVGGHMILDEQVNASGFNGTIELKGAETGTNFTFDTKGVSLLTMNLLVNLTTTSDKYQLVANDLNVSKIQLKSGTFSLNGQSVVAGVFDFDITGDEIRAFDFDGQTVVLSSSGTTDILDLNSFGGKLTLLNSSTARIEFVGAGQIIARLGSKNLNVPTLDFKNSNNIDIYTSSSTDNSQLITIGDVFVRRINARFDIDNSINKGVRKHFGAISFADGVVFNMYHPNGTSYGVLNSQFNSTVNLGVNTKGYIDGDFIVVKGDFSIGTNSQITYQGKTKFEGTATFYKSTGNGFQFGSDVIFAENVYLNGLEYIYLSNNVTFLKAVEIAPSSNVNLITDAVNTVSGTSNGIWTVGTSAKLSLGNGNTSNWIFADAVNFSGSNSLSVSFGAGTLDFDEVDMAGNQEIWFSSRVDFEDSLRVQPSGNIRFRFVASPAVNINGGMRVADNSIVKLGDGYSSDWAFGIGSKFLIGDNCNIYINSFDTHFDIQDFQMGRFNTLYLGYGHRIRFFGSFVSGSSNCSGLNTIKSISIGSKGQVEFSTPKTVFNVTIQDINVRTNNLTVNNGNNISNNTGISFVDTTYPIYWVGGTSAAATANKGGLFSTGNNNNWSNPDNWSVSNGVYTGSNSCLPRIVDNVVFNSNSFTPAVKNVVLDISGQAGDLVWTGVTNNPIFTAAVGKDLAIGGGITLDPAMTWNNAANIVFSGNVGVATYGITTAGHTLAKDVTINVPGATVIQQNDDLTITGELKLEDGKYSMNGHDNTLYSFNANINTTKTREIDFGSGRMNITGGGVLTALAQQIVFDLRDNNTGNLVVTNGASSTIDFIGNVDDVQLQLGMTAKIVPNLLFTGTRSDIVLFTRQQNNCTGNNITIGDITVIKDGVSLNIDNNADYSSGTNEAHRGNRKTIGKITMPNNPKIRFYSPNNNTCGALVNSFSDPDQSTVAAFLLGDNMDAIFRSDYLNIAGASHFGMNTRALFLYNTEFDSDVVIEGSVASPNFEVRGDLNFNSGTLTVNSNATISVYENAQINNLDIAIGADVVLRTDRSNKNYVFNGDVLLNKSSQFQIGEHNANMELIFNGNVTVSQGAFFETNNSTDSTRFNGNLSFDKGSVWVYGQNSVVFINGGFTATGSCTEYISFRSTANGNAVEFQVADSSYLEGVIVNDWRNMSEDLVVNNGQDGGGNLNGGLGPNAFNPVQFVNGGGGTDYYWIGGKAIGAGNNLWSDAGNWSTVSGALPGTANVCTPGETDNVTFDAASFDGIPSQLFVEMDLDNISLNRWDWLSVDDDVVFDNAATQSVRTITVFGDFDWNSRVTNKFEGKFIFDNTANNYNNRNFINPNGVSFFGGVRFDKQTTTHWELVSDLDINGGERGDLEIERGILDPAGHTISVEDDLIMVSSNGGYLARDINNGAVTAIPYTVIFDGPSSNPTTQMLLNYRNSMTRFQMFDIIIEREDNGVASNNTVVIQYGDGTTGQATYDRIDGNIEIRKGNLLIDNDLEIIGDGGATDFSMADGTYLTLIGSDAGGARNPTFPEGFGTYSFHSNSTVRYARLNHDNGAADGFQDISNTPVYGNIVLSGRDVKTIVGGDLRMNGSLSIAENVTLADNGNQILPNVDGMNDDSFVMGSNSRFVVGATGGNTSFPIGFNSITLDNTLGGEAIIQYNGDGAQNVDDLSSTNSDYPVLQISNNGIKTITGNVGILRKLIIDGASTLSNAGGDTLEFKDGNGNSDWIMSGTATYVPGGTVWFNGTNHTINDGTGTLAVNDLVLECPNGLNLSSNLEVRNNLKFVDGIIKTNTKRIYVSNPSNTAIIGATDTKFIFGTLRQQIASNTDVYTAPIADGTNSTDFHKVQFVNNNLTGVNYIDFSVAAVTESGNNVDAKFLALGVHVHNKGLVQIAAEAEWKLTPDAAPTGGSYGVRLFLQNITELDDTDDNTFTVMKRPDASNSFADFTFGSSDPELSMPDTSLAGRIYSGGAGYAERTDFTSFTKFMLAFSKDQQVLPVELVSFTGKKVGTDVVLKWLTSAEVNSDKFIIERSADLHHWEEIGRVKSVGNSSELVSYEFVDEEEMMALVYYRIKEMDYEGTIEVISDVVVVGAENNHEFEILNLHPNPVRHGELNVDLLMGDDMDSEVLFTLYDMNGTVVDKQTFIPDHTSFQKFVIQFDQELASGTYVLHALHHGKVLQALLVLE